MAAEVAGEAAGVAVLEGGGTVDLARVPHRPAWHLASNANHGGCCVHTQVAASSAARGAGGGNEAVAKVSALRGNMFYRPFLFF